MAQVPCPCPRPLGQQAPHSWDRQAGIYGGGDRPDIVYSDYELIIALLTSNVNSCSMSASRLFPRKKPFPQLSSPAALVRRQGTGTARGLAAPPYPWLSRAEKRARVIALIYTLVARSQPEGLLQPAPLPSPTRGLWGRSQASEAVPAPQVKGSAVYFPCSERVLYFHPPLHSSAPRRRPPSPSPPSASQQNGERGETKAPIAFLSSGTQHAGRGWVLRACRQPPREGLSPQRSFELNIPP